MKACAMVVMHATMPSRSTAVIHANVHTSVAGAGSKNSQEHKGQNKAGKVFHALRR